jgi:hypothetical protein
MQKWCHIFKSDSTVDYATKVDYILDGTKLIQIDNRDDIGYDSATIESDLSALSHSETKPSGFDVDTESDDRHYLATDKGDYPIWRDEVQEPIVDNSQNHILKSTVLYPSDYNKLFGKSSVRKNELLNYNGKLLRPKYNRTVESYFDVYETSEIMGVTNIASRRELFVDNALVETEQKVTYRLGQPRPENIVINTDEAWEGNTCAYFTVFWDSSDSKYKMYYRGSGTTTDHGHTCYAESTDGINWTKPNLGKVTFDGNTNNNILNFRYGSDILIPFKDTNPNAAADALYKGVVNAGDGLVMVKSSDGIDWTNVYDEPAGGATKSITSEESGFDSQNLAFWDEINETYRCYYRLNIDGIRRIYTATSPDFINWTDHGELNYEDAPTEHMYTNQIMPYYRANHILVGFPGRYIPTKGGSLVHLIDGTFMASRDGYVFNRVLEAMIRPGRNSSKWQNRSNYIWWGLLETDSLSYSDQKELSLYVNEDYYEGVDAPVRRYSLRIDGFRSVNAGYYGGYIVMRPVQFSGSILKVNYSTSAYGYIKVELQDENGNPINGYSEGDCPEIYGDEIDDVVSWNGGSDVSSLAGQTIKIKFILKDADLYSFKFE